MTTNRVSVFDNVRGRWKALLPLLGVEARFLTGRHGPCPMCAGTDRWRFDDKQGFGTWICSQCGAGGPLKLLERLYGWGPAEVAQRLEKVMGEALRVPAATVNDRGTVDEELVDKLNAMTRKWNGSRKAGPDGPVWRYLRMRAISYDPSVFLRERVYADHAEMLAMVQMPSGVPCQVHRTVVAPDEVVRYLMPGPHPAGSAARLMPWKAPGVLGIAEGVETALSASQCYGVPVWAALNAGRLRTWAPPLGCTRVMVFADNDINDVGRDAAVFLAQNLEASGLQVRITMPKKPGFDYNDCLIEARCGDALEHIGTMQ